jgi:galactokinase
VPQLTRIDVVSPDQLRAQFREKFGVAPRLFSAPGRVNLIGEHTDYNDGFVMPAAIRFRTLVASATEQSGKLVLESLQQTDPAQFSLADSDPKPRKDWTDYVRGIQLQLQGRSCMVPGAKLLISSDVPIGAGLSSSAALEIATALSLLNEGCSDLDKLEIAKLAQKAENEFVGARCGIMDQFASLHGRAGFAMLLDCRSLAVRYVRIPSNLTLVICNTMVKHSLASGEYNVRRAQCEECVLYFARFRPGIRALRDVTVQDIEQHGAGLTEVLLRRCRHVVTENDRTVRAADALDSGDVPTLGGLMYDSHASLRDDYEVSCSELDLLVDIARNTAGVLGARMTGGGFGGCAIALVERSRVDDVVPHISRAYEAATGFHADIYTSDAEDGAHGLQ